MSTQENIAIVRRFYDEVWHTGDIGKVDQFIAADYRGTRGPGKDREEYKQTIAAYRVGFPDIHWAFEELIAEGDKVVLRFTMHGTHQGEFQGVKATGKRVTMPGVTIFRLANGKIVERWTLGDRMGLLQQLGALPAPATS